VITKLGFKSHVSAAVVNEQSGNSPQRKHYSRGAPRAGRNQ